MKLESFLTPKRVGNFTVYNVTPVPGGDSLLFVNDKTAFVYDTGFGFSSLVLAENIRKILEALGSGRTLDYILLTHSHYDHALGSATLRTLFPETRVIASPYAAYVFTRDGAKRTMMRLDNLEAERQGMPAMTDYINNLSVDIEVGDCQRLSLAGQSVTVLALPGHTKDCISFYFEEDGIMLGCESVGVLASLNKVIPASLVSFKQSMASIERVSKMSPEYYFVPHQGMLEKEGFSEYIKISRESHEEARRLIIDGNNAGMSVEEIKEKFLSVFYLEKCREIYPLSAVHENLNAMIPMIIAEE